MFQNRLLNGSYSFSLYFFFNPCYLYCIRSIVWLQNMQDANLERARGHPTRRLETTEFRIGRLKHERVTVPRGDDVSSILIFLLGKTPFIG